MISTLKNTIRRIQPLADAIKEMDAIISDLDERIGDDAVVVVERKVVVEKEVEKKIPQTIDDSVEDVLKAIRPDFLGMRAVDEYGRSIMIVVFQEGAVAVDFTGTDTGGAVRKILQEVLAA